jgi:pilus assembly protein CpaF
MEGDVITMQEIFAYHQTGVDADGRIVGHFQATGVRPRFTDRLRAFGIHLPEQMFDPGRRYS